MKQTVALCFSWISSGIPPSREQVLSLCRDGNTAQVVDVLSALSVVIAHQPENMTSAFRQLVASIVSCDGVSSDLVDALTYQLTEISPVVSARLRQQVTLRRKDTLFRLDKFLCGAAVSEAVARLLVVGSDSSFHASLPGVLAPFRLDPSLFVELLLCVDEAEHLSLISTFVRHISVDAAVSFGADVLETLASAEDSFVVSRSASCVAALIDLDVLDFPSIWERLCRRKTGSLSSVLDGFQPRLPSLNVELDEKAQVLADDTTFSLGAQWTAHCRTAIDGDARWALLDALSMSGRKFEELSYLLAAGADPEQRCVVMLPSVADRLLEFLTPSFGAAAAVDIPWGGLFLLGHMLHRSPSLLSQLCWLLSLWVRSDSSAIPLPTDDVLALIMHVVFPALLWSDEPPHKGISYIHGLLCKLLPDWNQRFAFYEDVEALLATQFKAACNWHRQMCQRILRGLTMESAAGSASRRAFASMLSCPFIFPKLLLQPVEAYGGAHVEAAGAVFQCADRSILDMVMFVVVKHSNSSDVEKRSRVAVFVAHALRNCGRYFHPEPLILWNGGVCRELMFELVRNVGGLEVVVDVSDDHFSTTSRVAWPNEHVVLAPDVRLEADSVLDRLKPQTTGSGQPVPIRAGAGAGASNSTSAGLAGGEETAGVLPSVKRFEVSADASRNLVSTLLKEHLLQRLLYFESCLHSQVFPLPCDRQQFVASLEVHTSPPHPSSPSSHDHSAAAGTTFVAASISSSEAKQLFDVYDSLHDSFLLLFQFCVEYLSVEERTVIVEAFAGAEDLVPIHLLQCIRRLAISSLAKWTDTELHLPDARSLLDLFWSLEIQDLGHGASREISDRLRTESLVFRIQSFFPELQEALPATDAGGRDAASTVLLHLLHAGIFPRLRNSHADAFFCARFLQFCSMNEIRHFRLTVVAEFLLLRLEGFLAACTERQASYFGVFLSQLLKFVARMSDGAEEHAAGGSALPSNGADAELEELAAADSAPGHQRQQSVYRDLVQGITRVLCMFVSSVDYIRRRVGLTLLSTFSIEVASRTSAANLASVKLLRATLDECKQRAEQMEERDIERQASGCLTRLSQPPPVERAPSGPAPPPASKRERDSTEEDSQRLGSGSRQLRDAATVSLEPTTKRRRVPLRSTRDYAEEKTRGDRDAEDSGPKHAGRVSPSKMREVVRSEARASRSDREAAEAGEAAARGAGPGQGLPLPPPPPPMPPPHSGPAAEAIDFRESPRDVLGHPPPTHRDQRVSRSDRSASTTLRRGASGAGAGDGFHEPVRDAAKDVDLDGRRRFRRDGPPEGWRESPRDIGGQDGLREAGRDGPRGAAARDRYREEHPSQEALEGSRDSRRDGTDEPADAGHAYRGTRRRPEEYNDRSSHRSREAPRQEPPNNDHDVDSGIRGAQRSQEFEYHEKRRPRGRDRR